MWAAGTIASGLLTTLDLGDDTASEVEVEVEAVVEVEVEAVAEAVASARGNPDHRDGEIVSTMGDRRARR